MNRRKLLGSACGVALATSANIVAAAAATSQKAQEYPRGFLWGVAGAGHQIEGNNVNSDIWLLEHVKPTMFVRAVGRCV